MLKIVVNNNVSHKEAKLRRDEGDDVKIEDILL